MDGRSRGCLWKRIWQLGCFHGVNSHVRWCEYPGKEGRMDVSIYTLMIVRVRGRVSGRLHLVYTSTAYGIYLNCICSCMSQSFP